MSQLENGLVNCHMSSTLEYYAGYKLKYMCINTEASPKTVLSRKKKGMLQNDTYISINTFTYKNNIEPLPIIEDLHSKLIRRIISGKAEEARGWDGGQRGLYPYLDVIFFK